MLRQEQQQTQSVRGISLFLSWWSLSTQAPHLVDLLSEFDEQILFAARRDQGCLVQPLGPGVTTLSPLWSLPPSELLPRAPGIPGDSSDSPQGPCELAQTLPSQGKSNDTHQEGSNV